MGVAGLGLTGRRSTRRPAAAIGAVLAVASVLCASGCGAGRGTGVWEVAPGQRLTAESRSVVALVTRVGCAGGVTGPVLPPEVTYEPERILIRTDLRDTAPRAATCQGNDQVRLDVELTEPLGRRALVDAACTQGSEAATTSFCSDPVRRQP